MTDVRFAAEGVEALPDVMRVMADAFDPSFGEAWTAQQVLAVLAMPHASLLVARCAELVAFALVRSVFDEAELMLLAVRSDYQQRGIGARLLQHSCSSLVRAGATKYFLEVRADNPAVRLYTKAGFIPVGQRRNYYRGADGTRRDALTLKRVLP